MRPAASSGTMCGVKIPESLTVGIILILKSGAQSAINRGFHYT
jgi:hypothetical protein